jgi:hypothetical protein
MKIVVYSDVDEEIWMRDGTHGLTSSSYRSDGILTKVISALEDALFQAKGDLGVLLHIADVVPDVCLTAAKIDRGIPVAG